VASHQDEHVTRFNVTGGWQTYCRSRLVIAMRLST
jgi:hypothetical protein